MTREEYNQVLKEIVYLLINKPQMDATEVIEKLGVFKPVGLSWFAADALNRTLSAENLEAKGSVTYNHSEMEVFLAAVEELYRREQKEIEVQRIQFTRTYILEEVNSFSQKYMDVNELAIQILSQYKQEETINVSLEKEFLKQLYIVEDYVSLLMYFYIKSAIVKNPRFNVLDILPCSLEKVLERKNMGYLKEEFSSMSQTPCLFVKEEYNSGVMELLAWMLTDMRPVYIIETPIIVNNDNLSIKETVIVSEENRKSENGLVRYTPIVLERENGTRESNIDELICVIHSKYHEQGMVHVIGNGYCINDLGIAPSIQKKYGRITEYAFDKRESNLAIAWYGDYLDYISKIYLQDCHELINKKPTKRISVIIPARNSAKTLRYTLQTCLNQDWESSNYEILISDNSDQNDEVYKLCQELNDSRIRYIKTPRNLPLAKSFEYAYLKAEGEFLFAIGADDGLLPWTMRVLDSILHTYPDYSLLRWTRGFYAWPGFNGGNEHLLNVPYRYREGMSAAYIARSEDIYENVNRDYQNMYSDLCNLYLNSGMKRSYMMKFYDKVGRLWDTSSQDIPMGMLNLFVENAVLHINIPLTIAGMSPNSIGFQSQVNLDEKQYRSFIANVNRTTNIGSHIEGYYERFHSQNGVDVSLIANGLFEAKTIGCDEKNRWYDSFDKERLYDAMVKGEPISKEKYMNDIYELGYAASLVDTELGEYIKKTYANLSETLYIIDEMKMKEVQNKKSYIEVDNGENGVIVDASKYGVKNIVDAVSLFVRLFEE